MEEKVELRLLVSLLSHEETEKWLPQAYIGNNMIQVNNFYILKREYKCILTSKTLEPCSKLVNDNSITQLFDSYLPFSFCDLPIFPNEDNLCVLSIRKCLENMSYNLQQVKIGDLSEYLNLLPRYITSLPNYIKRLPITTPISKVDRNAFTFSFGSCVELVNNKSITKHDLLDVYSQINDKSKYSAVRELKDLFKLSDKKCIDFDTKEFFWVNNKAPMSLDLNYWRRRGDYTYFFCFSQLTPCFSKEHSRVDDDNSKKLQKPTSINETDEIKSINSSQKKSNQPKFLINNFMTLGSFNILYAATGNYKTWFAMTLGIAVASGKKFLRWDNDKKRKVLYVDAEMGDDQFRNRMEKIKQGLKIKSLKNDIPFYYECISDEIDISKSVGQKYIEDLVGKCNESSVIKGNTKLIILDNLYSLMGSSLSDKRWENVNRWVNKLLNKGLVILLIHHAGQDGNQYGAITKLINASVVLKLDMDKQEKEKKYFQIIFEKHRHLNEIYSSIVKGIVKFDNGISWNLWDNINIRNKEIINMKNKKYKTNEISFVAGISERSVTDIIKKESSKNN